MHLSIQKLSKRYNANVVFRDLTFDIEAGSRFAITGPNGSGKSTLLKILSGGVLPSSGQIEYRLGPAVLPAEEIFRYIHFVAPYNTVIEELTLPELFLMHRRLGLLRAFDSYNGWLSQLAYAFPGDRQIKSFSSGMKQRVKLGLALLDDRPVIFLDEPGSNLDAQGKAWMTKCIASLGERVTLIIASNDPEEIRLCRQGTHLDGVPA